MLESESKGWIRVMFGTMLGLFVIGFIMALFIKGKLKRLEAEKEKALEKQGSAESDACLS